MHVTESAHESTVPVQCDPRWKLTFIISLVLFGLTTAVFWPACQNGFLNWDDGAYVARQPEVLNGIRWKGILWATTAKVASNWHPLTLMSLQLDAQLFGPGPAGFHRTAVLLHAVNAAMAFLTILALTGCPWKSAIVAGLFRIHPMRVESVAWISERKDLLSGFFFFLTILAYVRYVDAPSLGRYLVVAFCLAIGLSAKSMLVTTPCVLLLLDYWPLARLRNRATTESPKLGGLILEKIPLFALSAITSIVTVIYQKVAFDPLEHLSLWRRVVNATSSDVAYLANTIWPAELSPFYARHDISVLQFCGAATFMIALTGLAVWQCNRRPYLLVGWLWFLGMLVPVCGLVQVGSQARADRYTYLPQIGLFLAIVWGVSDLVQRSRRGTIVSAALIAVFLTGCGLVTVRQIAVWRDSESLWRRTYSLDPNDRILIEKLITCLLFDGKKADALRLTHEALRNANDADSDTLVMLAMMLARQGEHQACVQTLDRTLKYHPDKAELYSNRGKAHSALGKWQEAADDYRRASQLSPRSASFQFYLAHALGKIGRQEEAQRIYAEVLRHSPRWPQNAARDSWRMSTSPDPNDRIDFWPVCLAEQAIEATPESWPPFLDVLAAAYAHSSRFEEAIATAKRAVQQAEQANQTAFAAIVRKRLELYETHQPYRESGVGTNSVP